MMPEIRRELRRFAEITTVKGIGRTVRANNGVARTCWVVFLVGCLALLLFQVITVLMNYYSYVVIRNSAVIQTSPEFPDVTVCNLFPVADQKTFDERYNGYLRRLDYLRRHSKTPEYFKTHDGFWYFLRSLIVYNVNALDHRIANESDPNKNGFVVECRENQWDLFNGVDCPLASVHNRPLQRCVRFRATLNDTALIKMMLFIDDFWSDVIDSFYSWTRMPMSTGVRVMVHPRGSKPDATSSIFVAPGNDITITVKQTNISRMSYPRGNCTNRRLVDSDGSESVPYNQATCIGLCRQEQILQDCSCIDTFEFFSAEQLQLVNGTFCLNVTQFLTDVPHLNDTVIDDLWKAMNCWWNINPEEEKCDCPVQCSERSYDFSVSGARWPSPPYQLAFYDRYLRNSTHYAEKFSAYETIRMEKPHFSGTDTLRRVRDLKLIEDNFLQVTVKMNERTVTTVTDILAMSWDTMASNLGGSLNLWLGISVLTAAEIIELFYSLMQIVWNANPTDGEVSRKAEESTKPSALK